MPPQPPPQNYQAPVNNPLMALLTRGAPSLNQQQPTMPTMPAPQPPVGGAPSPPAQGQPAPTFSGHPELQQVPQVPGMVSPGPGNILASKMAQIGAQAPTPPINPVVETFDNAPPIVREALRRRLFTQGQ